MQNIGLGRRHLQYFLLFLGGFIAYFIRASLSVSIVAMIDKNPPHPWIKTYPEWKNKDVILSSFFWGYIVLQIPAGLIGHKYGPKYFLGTSFIFASIVTLLTPYLAEVLGSYGVILSRVIQGLTQGFLFPSVHNILSKWTPLPERSRTFSFVYSSPVLGSTVSMLVTGYICSTSYGWPMVFYSSGCAGILWGLLFFYACKDRPQDDHSLSEQEKLYLEQNIPACSNQEDTPVPWKKIFTSLPVWAIILANAGNNYGVLMLLFEIPSYMQGVLKYDIKSNSLLSSLPFLTAFLMLLVISPISDYLITRKIFSIKFSRKFFNTFGLFTAAISLVCLGYVPAENKTLAVLLLVSAIGLNSAVLVGFNVNHVDIAPNFAGILMGFSNCASQISAIAGPLVVQFVVTDQTNPAQWRIVFLSAAFVFVAAAIFFLFFADGEIQPWNSGNFRDGKRFSLSEYGYVHIKDQVQETHNMNKITN